jgi:hypothetical protein
MEHPLERRQDPKESPGGITPTPEASLTDVAIRILSVTYDAFFS